MKLDKKYTKILMAAIGLFIVILLIFPAWVSKDARKIKDETYENIVKVRLQCPDDHVQEVHPWNDSGYLVACTNGETMNGPWQGWQNGVVSIQGAFLDNQEHGTWSFHTPDGRLYQTITYEQGNEVEKIIFNNDNTD